jgi:hypothetical protein
MADGLNATTNTPSWLRSVFDGAVLGGFSKNDSATKRVTEVGTGLIPVVGQLADARDTFVAGRTVWNGEEGGWKDLGFAALGWIPLAGDFAKSVRRSGFGETVSNIFGTLSDMRASWSTLGAVPDTRSGSLRGLRYHPGTDLQAEDLGNALGTTNRYGDIKVLEGLTAADRTHVFNHERVHRFFSPTFAPFQDFRAKLGLWGYHQIQSLRRVEEGLAEAFAGFKERGVSGIRDGWNFPYRVDYGLSPERMRVERNVVIGVGATAISTGSHLARVAGNDDHETFGAQE